MSFRIIDLINHNPAEALALQMPYLSQVTGQTFTPEDGAVIYKDLDPFVSFDAQTAWFEDENDPLYMDRVIGAQIASFQAQGAFRNGPPKIETIVLSRDVHREMIRLRDAAIEFQQKLSTRSLSETQRQTLQDAKTQSDRYNYLDAERLLAQLAKDVGV